MNIDTAYEILDKISANNKLNSNDLKLLLQLSQSKVSEIRAYVAELLVLSQDSEAEKTLIKLCDDEDELVRINACDSLAMFPSIDTYSRLIKSANDDDSMLVKEYAILSITDIINSIEINDDEFKNLLILYSNSKKTCIRAACNKGLYVLGDDKRLNELIRLLKSNNYQDRCTVLNILKDIISEKNKNYILSAVKQLQQTEDSDAVNTIIDEMLGSKQC